jgi:hypothetical protein
VSGATVVVVSETGDSAVAREDLGQRTDGRGAGMYRFRNIATDEGEGDSLVAIVPGRRYTLHIRTTDDEVVTGSTLVPSATPVQVVSSARAFDRDVDSIFAFWEPVPDAVRYSLRVDGARGPFQLFVDSAEYLIAGSLRNTNVSGLPAVFFPGFDQRMTVGAVDRNYFDYYRSSNDPFTGSGLVTHLDGALGVFGAYVLVYNTRLTVSETFGDEAWEGDYDRQVPFGSAGEVPATFRIYLESVDGPNQRFSGNWRSPVTGQLRGLVGSTSNDFQLTIALLAGQSARDTLMVLDLQPRDGRLIGHVRESGLVVEYLPRTPP